ncbi:MAG: SRPBCC domain-containing protein, partial [Pseudomonadota bacterium]
MTQPLHELAIERQINATPETVFKVWTQRTEEWFCPKPWKARVIEQDFRAGGRSCLVMIGPDGTETPPMDGIFLEVIPNQSIVFTDAFTVGWIPQSPAFMVGFATLTPNAGGTLYRAGARHWS